MPADERATLTRWTDADLDELQAECLRRHLLDPLWMKVADALGSVRFDKVDLKQALKEADRRAREDAAQHIATMREALEQITALEGEALFATSLKAVAIAKAAIRASITTAEKD